MRLTAERGGDMATGGEFRAMFIVAHPDDADIHAGAMVAKLAGQGARVRIVALCNGDKGHHAMTSAALAARRYAESRRAAAVFGVEDYLVLPCPDCEIEATLARRAEVTRIIRRFAPHVVFTHRTCDYHADHRATGTLVTDAAYLLGVPLWCPDVPRPTVLPSVYCITDDFTVPRPLRPDLLIASDPHREKVLDAIACHESQVYEWLPWDRRQQNVPDRSDTAACRAFLEREWFAAKRNDAARFAAAWREQYPGIPLPDGVEAYELSEYARPPTPEELAFLRDRPPAQP